MTVHKHSLLSPTGGLHLHIPLSSRGSTSSSSLWSTPYLQHRLFSSCFLKNLPCLLSLFLHAVHEQCEDFRAITVCSSIPSGKRSTEETGGTMPAPAAPGDSTHDLSGSSDHMDSSRTRRRPLLRLCCLLPPGRTECKAGFRAEHLPGQGGPTNSVRYQCMPAMDKWGRGNLLWLTSGNRWPHVIACPLQQKIHELPSPSTHPTHRRTWGHQACLSLITFSSKHLPPQES